jgi:hypothetical protein
MEAHASTLVLDGIHLVNGLAVVANGASGQDAQDGDGGLAGTDGGDGASATIGEPGEDATEAGNGVDSSEGRGGALSIDAAGGTGGNGGSGGRGGGGCWTAASSRIRDRRRVLPPGPAAGARPAGTHSHRPLARLDREPGCAPV